MTPVDLSRFQKKIEELKLMMFPKNAEELKLMLKDDRLIQELEQHGIELRYDQKTDIVTIRKHRDNKLI